ncbi:MAG: gliding motility-associated C-terminal domain-containing protein [Bacteroidetes bacterium]|nr:gliding motility-associated C-terminal domain-containing protein [Bacteroidota bacterium]
MKRIIIGFTLIFCQFISIAQNRKFVSSGDIFGRRVFIKNNGQFNSDIPEGNKIQYGYVNGEEQIFFTSTGLTYLIQKKYPLTEHQKEELEHGKKINVKPIDNFYVNVSWENSNPNIAIIESEKQSWYHSFGDKELKSDCYKKITYKNVYNNIDIEYVFTNDKDYGIKYNVILNPGANPADIKIKYSGAVKGISLKKGNVIIRTPLKDIIEHAPESFQSNVSVASGFTLNDDLIGFNLINGYNSNEQLIIDPWVTNVTLATNNYAFDVDFDYAGNFFVYGGSSPFVITKYSPAGTMLWTFGGLVPSQNWNSAGSLPSNQYVGNFLVDKFSGKSFMGEGFNSAVGTRIVRIDANGIYDNMISNGNPNWNELWDMGFYCNTGTVFGIGGSVTSNPSAGILNQTTGNIVAQNFSGNSSAGQDIASHAIDPAGNVFFIFASSFTSLLNNKLMRVNAAFNGNVWLQPSTYSTLNEADNKSYIGGGMPFGNYSNGYNALAASANYLYYYDGVNLAAYNKVTGAKIGFTIIPGQQVKQQGGIAVDACDNLYLGGNGVIRCFNFNGTTFTPNGTIPTGATTPNNYVFDIKYYDATNELYASGSGFGGIYSAINSLTCTINQLSVTPICVGNSNGSAIASMTTNIPSPIVSYSWTNSSGIVVSTTQNSALLTNTATNLSNGNYTLFTQINAPCGPVNSQTFNVNCVCSVTAVASSSCTSTGISTTLNLGATAGFSTTPLTYSWTGPGGFTSTTPNQVVPTASSGVYTLMVNSPACIGTGTVQVTVPSSFTPVISSASVSCYNGSNGTATVSSITGTSTAPYTYTWSTMPVQNAVQASGLVAGSYSCAVTDAMGCTYSATTSIAQPAQAFLTLSNTSVTCNNGSNGTASVSAVPIANTSPYTYTWSTNPVQNTAQSSSLSAGTYTCALTDAIGCIFTGTTTIIQPPNVSVTISTNTTQVCVGSSINFTGLATGGTGSAYSYSWSTGTTGSTASMAETTGGTYSYSIIALDVNTCTATAVKTVTFITNPVLTCANKDVCQGLSVSLIANGANNYSWTPSSGLNTTSGGVVIATPNVTTVYTILGNNSFCTGVTTVTVGVIPYPNPGLSSPNQEICYGNSTTINASGAQAYIWSPAYAITSTSAPLVTVSPSVNTTYTIVSYNFSGSVICSVTQQMPILVVPQVTPSVSNNQVICLGARASLLAGGGNSYSWTPSYALNHTNTQAVTAGPTVTTIYTVHVANNVYCGTDATVAVIVNPLPKVNAGRDTIYNLDEPMFLNATGTGTLTWLEGENILCTVCPDSKIKATRSGCYVIESINEFGCKAKDEVCIDVTIDFGVYIPNAFTPNDDGLNDVFLVYGYSISDVNMEIYDRWGEKLFTSGDQKIGWNGIYKGTLCKNDVYVYKVKYKGLDGKFHAKTGHVTLTR